VHSDNYAVVGKHVSTCGKNQCELINQARTLIMHPYYATPRLSKASKVVGALSLFLVTYHIFIVNHSYFLK
jgi:hypothetical protein